MRESSQPCQLPLREVPGPHTRAPHGFRPIDLAREQGDHLGVAGTLQGGRSDSSGGEQALGLLDEAARERIAAARDTQRQTHATLVRGDAVRTWVMNRDGLLAPLRAA